MVREELEFPFTEEYMPRIMYALHDLPISDQILIPGPDECISSLGELGFIPVRIE
jgi:hypothetical protein